jgi:hypothetical protein
MRLSNNGKELTNVQRYSTPHLANAMRLDIRKANKEYQGSLQMPMNTGPIAVWLCPHILSVYDIQSLKEMFDELRRRHIRPVIPADAIRNNNQIFRTAAMIVAFTSGIKHFLPYGWEVL